MLLNRRKSRNHIDFFDLASYDFDLELHKYEPKTWLLFAVAEKAEARWTIPWPETSRVKVAVPHSHFSPKRFNILYKTNLDCRRTLTKPLNRLVCRLITHKRVFTYTMGRGSKALKNFVAFISVINLSQGVGDRGLTQQLWSFSWSQQISI